MSDLSLKYTLCYDPRSQDADTSKENIGTVETTSGLVGDEIMTDLTKSTHGG